jgi:hypothetical protein
MVQNSSYPQQFYHSSGFVQRHFAPFAGFYILDGNCAQRQAQPRWGMINGGAERQGRVAALARLPTAGEGYRRRLKSAEKIGFAASSTRDPRSPHPDKRRRG